MYSLIECTTLPSPPLFPANRGSNNLLPSPFPLPLSICAELCIYGPLSVEKSVVRWSAMDHQLTSTFDVYTFIFSSIGTTFSVYSPPSASQRTIFDAYYKLINGQLWRTFKFWYPRAQLCWIRFRTLIVRAYPFSLKYAYSTLVAILKPEDYHRIYPEGKTISLWMYNICNLQL